MENNYYKRVWLRLIGVFALLTTVPVAIMILVSTNSLRDAVIDKVEISLGRLIERKKDVITLYLKEKEDLLTMMVGMYPISYLGRQENLDTLFMAVNKTGSIVDLHVSDVFLGFRNIPHFVVAVSDPLKTYVLRATINSEQFNKLLLSTQIDPHGDSFIVNREGTLQTPSRSGMTELGREDRILLEHHEGTAIVQRDENILVRGDDRIVNDFGGTSIIKSEESMVATKWVKDGQWCLVVSPSFREALSNCSTRSIFLFWKNQNIAISMS